MLKTTFFVIVLAMFCSVFSQAETFESETFAAPRDSVKITFIGHGSLMLERGKTIIHVDPWSRMADYSSLPDADLILITNEHGDHFDSTAIQAVLKDKTTIVMTKKCAERSDFEGIILENGHLAMLVGVNIQAVPAYNKTAYGSTGRPNHPKGEGNGYVLGFRGFTVYIGGDTQDIPEMADLKGKIDVAFLPANAPHTMTPEMVRDAALMIMPKILYPYNFSNTDTSRIVSLLENSGIDVRIRKLQ